MDTENKDNQVNEQVEQQEQHPAGRITKLSGMYENWFLDYASYVRL